VTNTFSKKEWGAGRGIGLGLAVWLGVGLVAAPARAQTSGDNGTHDPSRMIESEGRVYVYSTGGGAKSSSDGLVWRAEPAPPWNRALLPNNQGIWAPDGLFLNGQYYLYGAMWSADQSSALVLTTSPTLNPASPNYKWTDRGVVVAGPVGVTHSCIDPAPVLDAGGNLWVVWGGGYPFPTTADSIFVTRLDNQTGLPLASDPGYKPPTSPGYAIAQGHKEGPYIHYHGGSYFLWYQTGNCCGGPTSANPTTYVMHVARAPSITGPYTGDRVFYATQTALGIYGPGHMGIYQCGGVERFTYHYYPNNGSVLGENALTWGSDGWPVAGPRVTTPLMLPCAQSTPPGGGTGGASGGGGGTGGDRDAGAMGAGGATGAGTGGITGAGGAPVVVTGGGGTGGGGAPVTGGAATGGTSVPGTGGAPAEGGPGSGAGCSCQTGGAIEGELASRADLCLAGLVLVLALRRRRRQA
jgi:Glycosyl hydrolases family 43